MPAEGPSLGVAPSGRCMCSVTSRKNPSSNPSSSPGVAPWGERARLAEEVVVVVVVEVVVEVAVCCLWAWPSLFQKILAQV